MRVRHMERIVGLDFAGYAIGGLAVGEEPREMYRIIDIVEPYMPQNKPRYLMGVGTPADILEAVRLGIDFFDCVLPTRNARHGSLYTWHGKLNLFNEKYARDPRPPDEGCGCPTCQSHSRAYLRHLIKAKEVLGMRLAVLHNLYFYNELMQKIRDAIEGGGFEVFYDKYKTVLNERAKE